jgi:molybdopterin converting factor small subunit
MTVKVLIPAVFRRYVGKQESIDVDAPTVEKAMESVLEGHEEFKRLLMSEEGGFRSIINIYVNDKDIRFLDSYDTKLSDGDILTIVPAIAGG